MLRRRSVEPAGSVRVATVLATVRGGDAKPALRKCSIVAGGGEAKDNHYNYKKGIDT